MKIGVALTENDPDGLVNMRFGRAEWFLVKDTETGQSEVFSGEGPEMSSGAGVATAQRLADLGVEAVIAGNYGPSSAAVLNAAGVGMYLAGPVKASEAIDGLIAGNLRSISQATTPAHSGLRRF